MRRLLPITCLAAVLAGLGVLASVAFADGALLRGTVGPGFFISLADASGGSVTHLDPGSYALTVDDKSDLHNFHLTGPGVDVRTSLDGVGTQTFALTLVDGTYTFVCDAHPFMRGSFTVGTVTTPPPPTTTPTPAPKRLGLSVTDTAVTLRAGASAVRRLQPGDYVVTVTDRSKRQNAHLVGAGVNRRTGIAFVGTATWRLTLSTGTLTVASDAKTPRLRPAKVVVSQAS
jgi:hypothetical protein